MRHLDFALLCCGLGLLPFRDFPGFRVQDLGWQGFNVGVLSGEPDGLIW